MEVARVLLVGNPSKSPGIFGNDSENRYQVLQVVTSFGPTSVIFFGAENVTSIWGINHGHFEEAIIRRRFFHVGLVILKQIPIQEAIILWCIF